MVKKVAWEHFEDPETGEPLIRLIDPDSIKPKHPIQPIVEDKFGVYRFKRNEIINYLWENKLIDLNKINCLDFSEEDQCN